MKNWKPVVYHPAIEFNKKPEWVAIVEVIKTRDNYRCKSCRGRKELTVHHIVSRENGGKDYPPNLVTLCKKCHNEIEELEIRTMEQIEDLRYNRKYTKKDKKHIEIGAIKWQQWVYGGYKRPCLM
jgi:5-methylcytosine-specific restriction endonuclease McrA